MTTTATPSAALVVTESICNVPERLVLAGFLAGYDGLTPEAYALHPPGMPPPSRPGRGIGGRPKQALMH